MKTLEALKAIVITVAIIAGLIIAAILSVNLGWWIAAMQHRRGLLP